LPTGKKNEKGARKCWGLLRKRWGEAGRNRIVRESAHKELRSTRGEGYGGFNAAMFTPKEKPTIHVLGGKERRVEPLPNKGKEEVLGKSSRLRKKRNPCILKVGGKARTFQGGKTLFYGTTRMSKAIDSRTLPRRRGKLLGATLQNKEAETQKKVRPRGNFKKNSPVEKKNS